MFNIKKLIALILCASLSLGIITTSVSAQESEVTTSAVNETVGNIDPSDLDFSAPPAFTGVTVPETETTTAAAEPIYTPPVPATEGDGEAAPQRPDTAPFRISVTVNGDPSTQRGITWFTKADTSSVVEIIDENCNPVNAQISYEDVFEFEGNYIHKALVSGLEPGKTYYFDVGNETVRSAGGEFVTDNDDSAFNFVAIADVQAGNLENFMFGADVLGAAFKTMPNAEFTVNLGDFTDDSTNEEWDYYDTAFGAYNLKSTIVPIAGNHDGLGVWDWFNNMFNLDTSESVQNLNGVNYSFDYGNAHFAVLNTNDILSVSIPQLQWLKNDMNSTDKDWKIVFMHKSPYSLGKDAKWPDALYLQSSLTKVLAMCDVDLVMSGHDHQYLRTKPLTNNKLDEDGTTFVLAGTAGKKRYEVRPFLANHFLKTENIAALTIQKDGYGNYWNGENWDNTKQTNIGGCFNTISIDGGKLTYNAYILADEKDANGNDIITNIDSFTLEKETGKNKATFDGDNTTSEVEFYLGVIPSFFGLATYTFMEWLPKFLIMVPELLISVIVDDVF